MKTENSKIELLAPAGNPEKLEIAIHYGADAVYLGGKDFSLRNFSGNFTPKEMRQGVELAHDKGVKVYVACNIFPRTHEFGAISDFLASVNEIGPDAVIIADPGVFLLAKEKAPGIPVHISVQANTVNAGAALFWEKMGATRINTARELSLGEVSEIASRTSLEIESFVHGAMCVSYSGRCLLSALMSGRDANRGSCSHPCRWKYAVMEEKRPGRYMPVAEDARGTYIFNSKDLCMAAHIPEMIKAGVNSLKIEGRMKGIHYLATVLRVYREAVDRFYEDPEGWAPDPGWIEELEGVSARGCGPGFYFGHPGPESMRHDVSSVENHGVFIGKIIRDVGGMALVEARNRFFLNEEVEVLGRRGPIVPDVIQKIVNEKGESAALAQPGERVRVLFEKNHAPNDIARRKAPR
ncbi:Peptidase U32 [Candidatus Desulfarcum epimagneticum]|uniref:Peptidase U32 n=1 Tax=uncultured Desulfobacteraceae bacterium TaxID=218296 RepID=A0A484HGE2_9BACT|nr:Peptidase U32 [uncultured Desulfobacteraceae bacterium]